MDKEDNNGNTAFIFSIHNNNYEIAKLLIDAGSLL